MKMAKIFTIMFALVLAVFCFNGPFAFGGDEHPWDEEVGGDGGDLDGSSPDPDPSKDIPTKIGFSASTPEAQNDGSSIFFLIKFSMIASTVL